METLNAQQLVDISGHLKTIARTLNEFQFANWTCLSKAQHLELNAWQRDILNKAQDLLAMSTVIIVEDASIAIQQMEEVTLGIGKTVKNLQDAQKVIAIAASVGNLCKAMSSNNPLAVGGAFVNLLNVSINS